MSRSSDLLKGRCLYIPRMGENSVRAFAAAFQSEGIEASAVPPSDQRTLARSSSYFSGDECYPAHVVFGDFLKVIEDIGPDRVALFLPTASGPCRFGQYYHYLRQVLRRIDCDQVPVVSPSCVDGYEKVPLASNSLLRTAWRAIMASDILQSALLRIRPYERNRGDADETHRKCMNDLCRELCRTGIKQKEQLHRIVACLHRSSKRFRDVPVLRETRPLIGVVGEIFCRLNEFSNQEMIRCLESHGAECWLSGITEWLAYTNRVQRNQLHVSGRFFSLEMLKIGVKGWILHGDADALQEPFNRDSREEAGLNDILERSESYLPNRGVLGEMVLSVGKTIYLRDHGASGVVDISPFCCMNGIVSQAIYPRISDEHNGFPVRVFFFDQSQKDLDEEVSIFMDLVRAYRARNSCL